jgi:casein kinase II subunit alpha
VLFHKDKTRVRLIDWGLAETHSPTLDYSVRVSTRCYKAPELLVNNDRKVRRRAVE